MKKDKRISILNLLLLFIFLFYSNVSQAESINQKLLVTKHNSLGYYKTYKQNSSVYLNNEPYSEITTNKSFLGLQKNLVQSNTQFAFDLSYGSQKIQIDYASDSFLQGVQFGEEIQSIQNPTVEFKVDIANELSNYLYVQLTPGLFDTNASVRDSRTIEGSSFLIGINNEIQKSLILNGYFYSRTKDKIISTTNLETLYTTRSSNIYNVGIQKILINSGAFYSDVNFNFEYEAPKDLEKYDGSVTQIQANQNIIFSFNLISTRPTLPVALGFYYSLPTKWTYNSGDFTFSLNNSSIVSTNIGIYF